MIRKDFIGLYAPVTYVMLAISTILVCLCMRDYEPTLVPGPSGSDVVCAFYYIFHVVLWIPVGVTLVIIQFIRHGESNYRATNDTSASDIMRHRVGLVVGLILVIVTFIMMLGRSDFFWILLTSIIANFVPAFVFYGLGYLLTLSRRSAIKKA